MIQLIGVILAALFFVLTVAVPRIAIVIAFAAVLIAWLALLLWHRRKLAELRELHVDKGLGQWRPVAIGLRWPKRCVHCQLRVHNWAEAGAHQDPSRSACAAHLIAVEAREAADEQAAREAPQWTATVIPSGAPGPSAGFDTMLGEGGDNAAETG
jgi:hypothetical protein